MEEGTRVDGKMGWVLRKGFNMGKIVFAAVFLMCSASFLVPALFVSFTIAFILALPCCFFLASYVCTEKFMKKLFPGAAFAGRSDLKSMLLPNKTDVFDEGIAQVAMSEPVLVQSEEESRTPAIVYREDEDMSKELKSWLESIKDEGRTNQSLVRGISEKGFKEEDKEVIILSDAKLEKVGTGFEDLSGKKNASVTRYEGEHDHTTTKESRGKDMGKSSNEMKVLYNEEQIWANIKALRKVVGYSVARNTTYSEEMKALYMFMGLELPASMLKEEDEDIAKVSERLYFLMSVIGIK